MSLVTTELWNARRWSAEEPRLAADGRPELACTLWGLPVRKRLLTAVAAHQAIDGGRRFDLSADARLEWTHAADLAPFETEPGELAHLAEGGAHVSCLRLTRLPETCVWQHALDVPAGTQFLQQPALTAVELADGCVRPAAVVGSYAVAAPDGRKVAHIPRPVAVDSRGERVWGTIKIAEGLSTVRFDRAALRDRLRWGEDGIALWGLDSYGNTSAPGSTTTVSNDYVCVAYWFTAPAGTASSISLYVYRVAGAVPVTMGFMMIDGSVPAQSAGGNCVAAAGFTTQNVSLAFTEKAQYTIVWNSDTSTPTLGYDTVDWMQTWFAPQAYSGGNISDPGPGCSPSEHEYRKYGVYVTYTPSGGGGGGRRSRARYHGV